MGTWILLIFLLGPNANVTVNTQPFKHEMACVSAGTETIKQAKALGAEVRVTCIEDNANGNFDDEFAY
jgi:hypothetical protein